ncbi:hypothetical protein BST61_g3161 [Cercospora zeina]
MFSNGVSTSRNCAWRSSQSHLIFVATFALFTETLLYGYIVPILKYMVEVRLDLPDERIQILTTALLANISSPDVFVGCAIGTAMVAWTPSVWVLFLGRIIQGIAGSATWIAAFSMLVDNIAEKRKGTILALAMTFVSCGVLSGPAISGAVFQLAGYWPTWSVPFVLIPIGFITPMLVVNREDESSDNGSREVSSTTSTIVSDRDESTRLLSGEERGYQAVDSTESNGTSSDHSTFDKGSKQPDGGLTTSFGDQSFYRVFLSNPRVLAGLANTLFQEAFVSGFDTTLPLHLINTFNWGTLPVGLMFLGLQVPSILLSLPLGGIRDRVGIRTPTVVGWILLIPSLWLIGASEWIDLNIGPRHFDGEPAVITGTVAIVKEMEESSPGGLGPNGANSKLSAIMEMTINMGIMLGPLIAGGLATTIGYYYMNCVLAVIASVLAITSLVAM